MLRWLDTSEGTVTLCIERGGSAQPRFGGDAYQIRHSCAGIVSSHLGVSRPIRK